MVNRTDIITRAWFLFREHYDYPAIPFRSIGRACFNACLRAAWAKHRAEVDLAIRPAEVIQARIDQISRELDELKYRGWGTDLIRESNRLNEELRPLARELLRRSLEASLIQTAVAPDLALAA